jgi:hypothetical protein
MRSGPFGDPGLGIFIDKLGFKKVPSGLIKFNKKESKFMTA